MNTELIQKATAINYTVEFVGRKVKLTDTQNDTTSTFSSVKKALTEIDSIICRRTQSVYIG